MKILRWLMALVLVIGMSQAVIACGSAETDSESTAEENSDGDAEEGETDIGDAASSEDDDAEDSDDADDDEAESDDGDAGSDLGTPDNPIIMSFVPSGEQEDVVTGSDTISELLEEFTGLTVESNVATSYAAVIEAMGAGNAHVGWLNTFSYILANEKYDVQPVLVAERFGSTSYASIIIAPGDGEIVSLADLADSKFCRPDPLSTSGWIIPSVMMQAAGLDPESDIEIVDSGNHDGVVTAVYNGDCDAGAVFDDARSGLEEEYPDVMEKLAVIETSAPIPNDNVAIISDLPSELMDSLVTGLLAIAADENGAEALATTYGIEAFGETDDSFYDDFRATLDAAGVDVEELAEE